jgi:hypothetical protein
MKTHYKNRKLSWIEKIREKMRNRHVGNYKMIS